MNLTIDTNVLIYTLPAPSNSKFERAVDVVARGAQHQTLILLLQALAEFSHVATRKFGVGIQSVHRRVKEWRQIIPIHAAGEEDLIAALDLVREHRFGFWDALLCATASRAGLDYLLTEDLQDGRQIGRLTIVNPFRAENDALLNRILPP